MNPDSEEQTNDEQTIRCYWRWKGRFQSKGMKNEFSDTFRQRFPIPDDIPGMAK